MSGLRHSDRLISVSRSLLEFDVTALEPSPHIAITMGPIAALPLHAGLFRGKSQDYPFFLYQKTAITLGLVVVFLTSAATKVRSWQILLKKF